VFALSDSGIVGSNPSYQYLETVPIKNIYIFKTTYCKYRARHRRSRFSDFPRYFEYDEQEAAPSFALTFLHPIKLKTHEYAVRIFITFLFLLLISIFNFVFISLLLKNKRRLIISLY
jgi:hypothetical protein